MNIAIIEDEQIHKELLEGYLRKWGEEAGTIPDITYFPSAESFLFMWEEKKDYDVLFVDIQMKEMNGMEMAKVIRQSDKNVAIVFTTGITDYLEEGYEVEAMHYLIKPIDEEKVRKCMDKVKNRAKQEKQLVLNHNGELLKVSESQIVYIEARGHNTIVEIINESNSNFVSDTKHNETKSQIVELNASFSELEKQLDTEKFVKCHRSYLCNIAWIHHIDKTTVYFDNGSSIPVSRRLYADVNQAFIRYFKRER